MRIQSIFIAGLLACATLQAAEPKSGARPDAPAAFARLKALVGNWEAATDNGKERLSYELTGGDTALVERMGGGQTPPMMTVYHLDGDRLILTHYCMAGNQPRMQAQAFNAQTGELEFKFLDATNLASPGAGHMHNVNVRLIDNDHFDAAWQFYENGKPKFAETFHYTRVR
jgi:hypothetical protein